MNLRLPSHGVLFAPLLPASASNAADSGAALVVPAGQGNGRGRTGFQVELTELTSKNGGFTSKNGSLSRNNKSFNREHHDFTSKNYLEVGYICGCPVEETIMKSGTGSGKCSDPQFLQREQDKNTYRI